jgi:phosphopentomutase
MSDEIERVRFRQVVVLVVEGLGIGAQTDAAADFDRGADTLTHAADYVGGLELPFMQWLGLGNLRGIRGVPPADPPAASVGVVRRLREGREAQTGARELFDGALEGLVAAGVDVCVLGWLADEVDDITGVVRLGELRGEAVVARLIAESSHGGAGVTVASFRAPASLGGPVAFSRGLTWFDSQIAAILDIINETTLLLVTGIGGVDPTFGARAVATREQSPLLAYTPAVPSGVALGSRESLGDIGATLAENFDVPHAGSGRSFFGPLLA